jgi:hypothetical protein
MNDANPQTPFQEAVCGGQWKVLSPFVAGNEEQTNAVLHVLKSKDLVTSIRGPAGSGKTTMMQEAVRAVAALSGKDVFRQQIAALRDAVYDLSAGKTESGFSKARRIRCYSRSRRQRRTFGGDRKPAHGSR